MARTTPHNFETLYKPVVDEWVYDENSGREPVLIGKGGNS